MTVTLTRASSGLLLRDDFGSDTSANYVPSDDAVLSVSGGALYESIASARAAVDADKTGKVVTIKGWRANNQYSARAAMLDHNTNPELAITSISGYACWYRHAGPYWTLTKFVDAVASYLATDGTTDLPAGAQYVYLRLFHDTSNQKCWCGCSWPLQVALTSNDNTYDAITLYDGMTWRTTGEPIDYFECRTGYNLICTGLPTGYQLQANGSSSYKATESGGTATLSVAVLEWPLTLSASTKAIPA